MKNTFKFSQLNSLITVPSSIFRCFSRCILSCIMLFIFAFSLPLLAHATNQAPPSSTSTVETSHVQTNTQDDISAKPLKNYDLGWTKYFQALGVMIALLIALWFVLKIIKKYSNGHFLGNQSTIPKDKFYIAGQLALGQGKGLMIVRVMERDLVIGVTDHNINLLTELNSPHKEVSQEDKDLFERLVAGKNK